MVEEDRVVVVGGMVVVVAQAGTAGVPATAATVLAARADLKVLHLGEAVVVAAVEGLVPEATVLGVTGSQEEGAAAAAAEGDDD